MPTKYVKKVAKEKGLTVDEVEKVWERAKKEAEKQGHPLDWPYITTIFDNMMKNKGKKSD